MSNLFKGIAGLIALALIVGAILINCSSDIILDAPLSLLGEYSGKYTITKDGRTNTYGIEMTFTDQTYRFDDTTKELCSPRGTYEYSNQINLIQNYDGQNVTCDTDNNPNGLFSFRKPGDSLILTQSLNNVYKEIALEKK